MLTVKKKKEYDRAAEALTLDRLVFSQHVILHQDTHSQGEHKTTDTHLVSNPWVYHDTISGLSTDTANHKRCLLTCAF